MVIWSFILSATDHRKARIQFKKGEGQIFFNIKDRNEVLQSILTRRKQTSKASLIMIIPPYLKQHY